MRKICNKDCVHCQYNDCINDEVDELDVYKAYLLDKEISKNPVDKNTKHYRYNHSEKRKIVSQRYNNSEKGKEVRKKWAKEYASKHPEIVRAKSRLYRERHKEECLKRERLYYQANKEKINARRRENRRLAKLEKELKDV